MAKSTYRMFEYLGGQKNIKMNFMNGHGPLFTMANDNELIRVINNMVSNAIKFTPQYGEITLAIGAIPG